MIGETDQRVDVRIEGEVSLPDHARLRLRFEGAGLDATPVEVVQEGVETYVLKDGERATGLVSFNTLGNNSSYAVRCNDTGTWADAHSNIFVDNGTALRADSGAQMFSDYNLFYGNSTNYNDTARGDGDLISQYPNFADGYHLRPTSRAVDAASPFADVPVGGGLRADMGYKEVLAAPVTIFWVYADLWVKTGLETNLS